jgi:hypothetical protein
MSLVRRCDGWCGYWISLDLIAVHLLRQRAILESWDAVPPPVCFGRPDYLERLEAVVRHCGLTWSRDAAIEAFDRSYVHETPASVPHVAQSLFEALVGQAGPIPDSQDNRGQLEEDARALESLRLQQWQANQDQLREAREQARRSESQVDQAQAQLSEMQTRLDEYERRRDQAQAQLSELQTRLDEYERRRDQARARLESRIENLVWATSELSAMQAELIRSHDREVQAWQQVADLHARLEDLHARLEKFEGHPVLGPALRGRRRLRRLWHGLVNSSSGV